MIINTAIFDMDGLLIDSEPLWHEAALEVMRDLGVALDAAAYASTVGLRTKEFLEYWFQAYSIDMSLAARTEVEITRLVIEKLKLQEVMMPGAAEAVRLLRSAGLRIGLATSSPLALVDAFFEKCGMADCFDAVASAEHLAYGKPHPQVYIECLQSLGAQATAAVCFEDSFNGMLAAKAARTRCIVVPAPEAWQKGCWEAADLKLPSLKDFTMHTLGKL
ncbi:MAG: hexitol phosphatase HxpB [Bacteroidetes bacterium]|nr:hexitol phosphatase HxpB [Bacteroidota bacterium]